MVRVLLLFLMGLIVLMMVSCPAMRHTKRTKMAFKEFFEARRADEAGSTAETKRMLEAARSKVEDARRLDRRENIIFEVVMLGVLGAAGYGFARAGKRVVDGGRTESER
jgi:hypothetical protein